MIPDDILPGTTLRYRRGRDDVKVTYLRPSKSNLGMVWIKPDGVYGERLVGRAYLCLPDEPEWKVGDQVEWRTETTAGAGTIHRIDGDIVVVDVAGDPYRYKVHTSVLRRRSPPKAGAAVCPDCLGQRVAGINFFGWLKCRTCGSTNA